MSNTFQIHCGEASEVMSKMETESVDCVVTSPPYDKLREYGGQNDFNFPLIAAGLFRVLKPGGILCWNVGDAVVDGSETLTSMRQAIHFVDVAGFRMHDTMIWQKPNFSNPSHNRYHQIWEYVFVLSKGKPKCFNPIKDKPNKYFGPLGKNTFRTARGTMESRPVNTCGEFGMRGNVWLGNTRGQEEVCKALEHPAMMPKWLARDLILSWSNVGDLVLDPCAGSGTTGHAAVSNGRRFIGIELNPEYIPIIESGINYPEPELSL